MPIYTRSGDQGETVLFDKKKLSKNDLRIAVIGSVDELNASLGTARAFLKNRPRLEKIDELLESLQKILFEIGAEIAGNRTYRLSASHTKSLEGAIDYYQKNLPYLNRFVLPAGSKPAGFLHLSRTICRRAERLLVGLNRTKNLNPELLRFLNRLSDFLFVLARYVNQESNGKETLWNPQ